MLCVLSGNNWNNGSNAGPWSVNLNNNRTNTNTNYGFSSDSNPHLKHQDNGETGVEGGGFLTKSKPCKYPLSGSYSERQWVTQ